MSATDTDSVRFGESPLEAIDRCCHAIEKLVGITTLQGERTRTLTRDIRAAADEINDHANLLTELLLEAQQEAN